MKESGSLVSIIIPVYNVEKYVAKCLDSILRQSYKNLEIICVNDCSTDNSLSIIKQIAEQDSRIKVISNKENKGLFRTRLVGADVAKGDYICFVDSDDYLTIDWIRLLLEKSKKENADMVMANTVQVDDKGCFIENNYMSLCLNRKPLVGKEIMDTFMEDAGLIFAWHTVWNKLYSMSLWKKARPEFEAIKGHLIMTEDIIYSSVLFYYSEKMAFSNHDAYFYVRNKEASTSVDISLDRIKKHIDDVTRVFAFLKQFLIKHNVYEEYEEKFIEYRKRNFRIQSNIIDYRKLNNNKAIVDMLCKGFDEKELQFVKKGDFYFYEIRTQWESGQNFSENLRNAIFDSTVDVVSFDLFDTLLVRPFLSPDKAFDFLAKKHADFLEENGIFHFVEKRKEAENVCRGEMKLLNPNIEDCTISEIYSTFAKIYNVSSEVTKILCDFEKETDFEFCRVREHGLWLFGLAKALGKKVIITTDTFDDETHIKNLLKANGIEGYDDLFISSKSRKLKATGSLYQEIKSKYKDKKILHIGDNWLSDAVAAKKQGLNAQFVSSTVGIARNIHYDNYTGDAYLPNTDVVLSFADLREEEKQLTLNACSAISMNRMFDKPFPSWNRELRYNANYYFIGNYVLGREMLGIASYLYDLSVNNGYKKVVFLARDGYLPKIAFDILSSKRNKHIASDYFYVSRQSLIPVALYKSQDAKILQDYVSLSEHTSLSLIDMISKYIKNKNALLKDIEAEGILPADKIGTQIVFEKIAKVLNKHLDFNLVKEDFINIGNYMRTFFNKDTLAFDLGYSGRIQSLISYAVGTPIDVCFCHSSGMDAELTAEKAGFKIYNYLQYTPKISSIIREYFFSEIAPSCVGYDFSDGKGKPIFADQKFGYIEKYMQGEFVRGMEDFVNDYCDFFGKYDFMFKFRSEEMSLPFETFINQMPDKDLFTFHICESEDMVYSNYNRGDLTEIWRYNLNQRKGVDYSKKQVDVQERENKYHSGTLIESEEFLRLSKFKRALVLFIADKKNFKKKLSKNLKKNKGE